jgi:hypothetical protein
MSLLDHVRQTLGEAAASARDMGQNLGAQAQTQLNIKKLQLEQTKKLHQLGVQTHAWHRVGRLVVTGEVPREVLDLCHQLDDLSNRLALEEANLQEAKRQAELRAAKGDSEMSTTYTILPDSNTTNMDASIATDIGTQNIQAVSDPNAIPPTIPGTPAPDVTPSPIPSTPAPDTSPSFPGTIPSPGTSPGTMPGSPGGPSAPTMPSTPSM